MEQFNNSTIQQLNNLNLLEKITTKSDAFLLDSELDTVLDELFKTKDLDKSLQKQVRAKTYGMIKQKFPSLTEVKPQIIADFINEIKEKVQKLRVIDLTIAFEPSLSAIEKFSMWAKENLGADVILNINIESSILGGAVIEFQGVYKDYSLKKEIEELFSKNRKKIADNVVAL